MLRNYDVGLLLGMLVLNSIYNVIFSFISQRSYEPKYGLILIIYVKVNVIK